MIQTYQTRPISRIPMNRDRAVDQSLPAENAIVQSMARYMFSRAKANEPTQECHLLRQGFSPKQIRRYGDKATELAQEMAAEAGVYKSEDRLDPETSDYAG